MIAILEDNPKSERTVGFSDTDIVEIYETSEEVQALIEQLQKKTTFADIIQFMIRQAKERGKPAGGGGGDACCGGGEDPQTPDSIITEYLPKLTETILEVFSQEPFGGHGSITPAGGAAFKFKGEQLLTTMINFSLRVLGGKLEEKRKIWVDTPDRPVPAGKDFTVTVRAEKLPFIREQGFSTRRPFVALINLTDNSMQLQEMDNKAQTIEKKFKIKP